MRKLAPILFGASLTTGMLLLAAFGPQYGFIPAGPVDWLFFGSLVPLFCAQIILVVMNRRGTDESIEK